jgi:Rieske Fe-S protein
MMSRKAFLKVATGAAGVLAISPLTSILHGCAPSAHVARGTVTGQRVIVPLSSLPDMTDPGAYTKVYIDGVSNPFLLFRKEGDGLRVVLSTCSHRGCEVRKMRAKFECPCHGSEYDLDGNVMRGPASEPLQSFPVGVVGERIEFDLGVGQ